MLLIRSPWDHPLTPGVDSGVIPGEHGQGLNAGMLSLGSAREAFFKKGFSAPPNILISGGGTIIILCQVLVALLKQEGVFVDVCKFPIVRLSY